MLLLPGLVRLPDVSFFRWERYPNRKRPNKPIPNLVPDLAIEVLSKGNTAGEMERKRKEYFLAGVQLVWQVDPKKRTVEVFTAPDVSTIFKEGEVLDCAPVLPGLLLPVEKIFARTTPEETKPKKKG